MSMIKSSAKGCRQIFDPTHK